MTTREIQMPTTGCIMPPRPSQRSLEMLRVALIPSSTALLLTASTMNSFQCQIWMTLEHCLLSPVAIARLIMNLPTRLATVHMVMIWPRQMSPTTCLAGIGVRFGQQSRSTLGGEVLNSPLLHFQGKLTSCDTQPYWYLFMYMLSASQKTIKLVVIFLKTLLWRLLLHGVCPAYFINISMSGNIVYGHVPLAGYASLCTVLSERFIPPISQHTPGTLLNLLQSLNA